MGSNLQHHGRGGLSCTLHVRCVRRIVLLTALPGLAVACSFNTDPAVHPPRGLAPLPPTALMVVPVPAPVTSQPILVRADSPTNPARRDAMPASPSR
jgi:hypothetical protein